MTKRLSDSKVSSMVISDYIPDGATVTPVDHYTIWLACAELPNTYGSLANVIADTTAMETLCNNLNALRYMVRSTATIMPAVLANGSWVTSLKSSTYSIKVPTMTSATTPSGVVTADSNYSGSYAEYKAFDGASGVWISGASDVLHWLRYQFTAQINLFNVEFQAYALHYGVKNFKMQGSNDGTTFTDLTNSALAPDNVTLQVYNCGLVSALPFAYIRLYMPDQYDTTEHVIGLKNVQFYGLDLN